jgi:phosphoglycolate phosphatase-like HAD superfamily hydrolase
MPDQNQARILLWDIDGTILRSAKATTFTEYTRPVLEAVFGTAGRIDEVPLTGMTDLQYIAECLSCGGITRDAILERIGEISARYSCEIERAASNGAEFHVLPGVGEALEAVSKHSHYHSAVLTGNFKTTALYKLNLVGLSDYFDLPGAFGDQSFDRRDLTQFAAQRIKSHLNVELQPSQFIIIGDTPDDIACAHHFGARSIAVATGHMYGFDELLRWEPDAVLPDLSETAMVMRTLEKL